MILVLFKFLEKKFKIKVNKLNFKSELNLAKTSITKDLNNNQ